ncbi:MAG TPA: copper resistance system multicopper oxidase [Steroidobacteraceae bacterium]|nr:copper resistance system multicopper oxidase [Steroidobacteraceae bacterium]
MSVLSRRAFVQGVAGCGFLAGTGRWVSSRAAADSGAILSGTEFDLTIGALAVNFTGRPRVATVVNGRLPAPVLRWREGDTVTLRVTNRLPVRSSVHWHGILLPAGMDGVPGLSFAGIAPGETFTYRFKVQQSGTYWYHAHSGFQEQTGLYGPIVIEPRAPQRSRADRDYTVLLSDWSDSDPDHIYATLKRQSDYYNRGERTVGDFLRAVGARGWSAAAGDWAAWGRMRMDPTDLVDVSGAAYTYLMNGTTPAGNWTAPFSRGESVRLRFINGSAMSFFDVRVPGLDLTVVAADGQEIEPVTVEEFRIAPGEVIDVLVRPHADSAYTIFAQSMDRSGYARGTLSAHAGLVAQVPGLDPRPVLAMTDMGMNMHMDMDMSGMKGMAGMDPAAMAAMPGMGAAGTSAPTHSTAPAGPGVDMVVTMPRTDLDDPGVGLRNNGRRVLTYADLHTIGGPLDPCPASREIELHLTGHMERFMWSFDGRKFSESEPLQLKQGERVRFALINDTMMSHPIHLHGHWSEVSAPEGSFQVRKHTVMVQPAQRLSYLVTAVPGRWAYHCHLTYHMAAGMFREVRVSL